jgi:hypothetical protein
MWTTDFGHFGGVAVDIQDVTSYSARCGTAAALNAPLTTGRAPPPGQDRVGNAVTSSTRSRPSNDGASTQPPALKTAVHDRVRRWQVQEVSVGAGVRQHRAQHEHVASPHPYDICLPEPPGTVRVMQVGHRHIEAELGQLGDVTRTA